MDVIAANSSASDRARMPPRIPARRSLLVYALPGAVLVLYAVLLVRTGMTVDRPPPWPRWSFVDFRDTIWVPSRDLFAGHDPYDLPSYLARHPNSQEFSLYAPGLLLAAAPLAALPWPVAMVVWGALLTGAFWLLAKRSAVIAGRAGAAVWVAVPLAFLLLSPVGNQSASAGQYAVIAAAACVVALSTRSPWVGAAATALALVKPQVGLPLLVLLVLQRRLRVALAAIGLAAAVSAPAVVQLVRRAGGVGAWAGVLAENLELSAASPVTAGGRVGSTRVDVVGTLQRIGLDPAAPTVAVITVSVAVLVVALATPTWRTLGAAADDPSAAVAWWSAAAAVLLLWTPSELYAALVAFPAVVLAASAVLTDGAGTPRHWAAVLPGLLLAVPFLHVHRLDAAIGLQRPGQVVNCLAIVAAAIAAFLLARRVRPRASTGPAG